MKKNSLLNTVSQMLADIGFTGMPIKNDFNISIFFKLRAHQNDIFSDYLL